MLSLCFLLIVCVFSPHTETWPIRDGSRNLANQCIYIYKEIELKFIYQHNLVASFKVHENLKNKKYYGTKKLQNKTNSYCK